MAPATGRPCAVSTSTCRSFATISSAVCLFLGILSSPNGTKPYIREDHFNGGRPIRRWEAFAKDEAEMIACGIDSESVARVAA